jgi:hypothetical protein
MLEKQDGRKQTTACQEKTEALLEGEKPNSVEMELDVGHQGVPREDAAIMPVEGRKTRHRGRKQAAGRHVEPKELNRGICGSRKKLAAAFRKMSRRATVAWRKRNVFRKILTHGNCGLRKEVTAAGMKVTRCLGHRHKGQNKDDVERDTRKGRTEEN